jgi:hypothetical protein
MIRASDIVKFLHHQVQLGFIHEYFINSQYLIGELKKILKNIVEADDEESRNKATDPLMEIIMLVQFANDECDYGEGVELGLCLFSYGGEGLHKMVLNLLPLGYQFLNRNLYGDIIKAHLEDRRHSAKLSQL